uniref:GRIP domain-containing protein n=1 Tax=Globodera rostochiensis TaxID=31243 RepID=A0A914HDN7_GLORO
MFKGLRSKLEDEAKRLQATVSQYGENLASQVRSNASDAGSDISGRGRKLLGSSLGAVQLSDSKPNKNVGSPENNDDTIISFHDEEPDIDVALSSVSVADGATPSSSAIVNRQRRLSNASIESNESSFSNFNFSSQVKTSPSFTLDPISSDVESNAGSVADLSSLDNVPNDKITSILQRLQGRAVDYKQKYRVLMSAYREIEKENEKYQMVLASTQDKALARIAKLKEERRGLHERCKDLELNDEKLTTANRKVLKMQELLTKCKDEITANRERIATLNEENKHLKEENAELSKEKLSAEWKGRFDRQEEEWTKRMSSCEEKAAISIATHKAEMHSAMQQKDQEIEGWIKKCHSLEQRDTDSNALWQEKLDALQKAIVALEHEKADMVQKLSQAKQEGVKLVKESEEKRHSQILSEELKKKDEEWARRVKELEEQMQLAVEESDLQRKTSVADHDRELSKLRERIEQWEREHSQILQQFYGQKEELGRLKEEELAKSEETSVARERETIVAVEKAERDKMETKLAETERELAELKQQMESREEEISRLVRLSESQKGQLSQQSEKLAQRDELETSLAQKDDQIEKLRTNLEAAVEKYSQIFDFSNRQKEELGRLKEEELAKSEETSVARERETIVAVEKAERDKMETKLAETERELAELKQQMESREEEISRLIRLSESQKTQLSEQSEKLVQFQCEKDEFESYLAQKDSQIDELHANLRVAEEKYSKIDGEIDVLKKESQCQIDRIAFAQKEETEKVEELERTLEKMKVEKETIDANLERMKKKEEKETEQREELLRRTEKERREMDLEIAAIKRERDERTEQNDKLQEQLVSFEEEKGHLKLELKSVKRELKGLKQVEAQFKEKVSEIERLNGELSSTERAREEAMGRIEVMEKRLKEDKGTHLREMELLKKEWEKAKQKGIADLQSEIRQLYHDINEKDCELAATHASISKLENELKALRAEHDQPGSSIDRQNSREQQRLDEQKGEVQRLKALVQQQHGNNGIDKSPTPDGKREFRAQLSNASDHLNFAEPTEAEYLRNVLYRYMTERETLGRESVTLAKVIATVCKFPPEQLSLVLRREESRCQAWLPGSVVHALTHPTLHHHLQRNAPQLSPSATNSFNFQHQQQRLMGGVAPTMSQQAPF